MFILKDAAGNITAIIEGQPVYNLNSKHWEAGTDSVFDPDATMQLHVAADLPAFKAVLMANIDDVSALRKAKAERFTTEYKEREAAANAYRDGGYVGEADEYVARFARNTGKTDRQATDLILQQADGLRAALKEIAGLRMDKYLVQAAQTVEAAQAKHAEIVAAIHAVVIP